MSAVWLAARLRRVHHHRRAAHAVVRNLAVTPACKGGQALPRPRCGAAQAVADAFLIRRSGSHSCALDNKPVILEILRSIPRRNCNTSGHLRAHVVAIGYEVRLRTVQQHLDATCIRSAIECVP